MSAIMIIELVLQCVTLVTISDYLEHCQLQSFYNKVRKSVTMSAIMIIELVLQCVTLVTISDYLEHCQLQSYIILVLQQS